MNIDLDKQIELTKIELDSYKSNKYSAKEIVDWLESVYQSLLELKRLNGEIGSTR